MTCIKIEYVNGPLDGLRVWKEKAPNAGSSEHHASPSQQSYAIYSYDWDSQTFIYRGLYIPLGVQP